MDLSKLPKFSSTPAPPPSSTPPERVPPTPAGVPTTYLPGGRYCQHCGQPIRPSARYCDSCGQPLAAGPGDSRAFEGLGLQSALSIIVALILLFMQQRLPEYILYRLSGRQGLNFFLPDGTKILYLSTPQPFVDLYPSTPEFLLDLGPFLFALVLILDGFVLALLRRKVAIGTTLALTAAVTLYNLGTVLMAIRPYGVGAVLISFLAAAFGGFMCWQQWTLLRVLGKPR
jgi:hypothetical protein